MSPASTYFKFSTHLQANNAFIAITTTAAGARSNTISTCHHHQISSQQPFPLSSSFEAYIPVLCFVLCVLWPIRPRSKTVWITSASFIAVATILSYLSVFSFSVGHKGVVISSLFSIKFHYHCHCYCPFHHLMASQCDAVALVKIRSTQWFWFCSATNPSLTVVIAAKKRFSSPNLKFILNWVFRNTIDTWRHCCEIRFF